MVSRLRRLNQSLYVVDDELLLSRVLIGHIAEKPFRVRAHPVKLLLIFENIFFLQDKDIYIGYATTINCLYCPNPR